jgi:hypothetical protein
VKIVAATALALALSATAASGASRSGLRGVVLIDPASPVCSVGQPCTAPAKHVWLVFSRRGQAVARTRTANDGSYRIALAPGTFAVSSPHHTLGRGLRPRGGRSPRTLPARELQARRRDPVVRAVS